MSHAHSDLAMPQINPIHQGPLTRTDAAKDWVALDEQILGRRAPWAASRFAKIGQIWRNWVTERHLRLATLRLEDLSQHLLDDVGLVPDTDQFRRADRSIRCLPQETAAYVMRQS